MYTLSSRRKPSASPDGQSAQSPEPWLLSKNLSWNLAGHELLLLLETVLPPPFSAHNSAAAQNPQEGFQEGKRPVSRVPKVGLYHRAKMKARSGTGTVGKWVVCL